MKEVGRQWLITELEKFDDFEKGSNEEMIERLDFFGITDIAPIQQTQKASLSNNYPKNPTEGWIRQAIIDCGLEVIRGEKRDAAVKRLIAFGFTELQKD